MSSIHTEQISADLEWPMWLVYLGLPIGSSLMCFRFLQVCWKFIEDRASSRDPTTPRSKASIRRPTRSSAAIENDENLRMGGKS